MVFQRFDFPVSYAVNFFIFIALINIRSIESFSANFFSLTFCTHRGYRVLACFWGGVSHEVHCLWAATACNSNETIKLQCTSRM